jgi:hypothetical protein
MVVGKGQQALARRNHTKRDLFSEHTTDGERKGRLRPAWSPSSLQESETQRKSTSSPDNPTHSQCTMVYS